MDNPIMQRHQIAEIAPVFSRSDPPQPLCFILPTLSMLLCPKFE